MSMNALERSVVKELKIITGNKKLGEKNLMEWSSSEDKIRKNLRDGEKIYFCPENGVWVAIK